MRFLLAGIARERWKGGEIMDVTNFALAQMYTNRQGLHVVIKGAFNFVGVRSMFRNTHLNSSQACS